MRMWDASSWVGACGVRAGHVIRREGILAKAKRKIVTDAVRRALNGSYHEADVPRARSIQLG